MLNQPTTLFYYRSLFLPVFLYVCLYVCSHVYSLRNGGRRRFQSSLRVSHRLKFNQSLDFSFREQSESTRPVRPSLTPLLVSLYTSTQTRTLLSLSLIPSHLLSFSHFYLFAIPLIFLGYTTMLKQTTDQIRNQFELNLTDPSDQNLLYTLLYFLCAYRLRPLSLYLLLRKYSSP